MEQQAMPHACGRDEGADGDADGGANGVGAVLVPLARRAGFLPGHFGKFFVAAESGVHNTMRCLCPDYPGGAWDFYALSNGGALLVPRGAARYRLRGGGPGEAVLPAFALGVGVCTLAYEQLSCQFCGGVFVQMAGCLHEFLLQQPEADRLLALLG